MAISVLRPRLISRGRADYPSGMAQWDRARLFGRQDRDRDRILLDTADLEHKGACRNLVLHGLANAVAIGGAAEGLWLQRMSVLHHVDPAAGGQAHRVYAGLRRS